MTTTTKFTCKYCERELTLDHSAKLSKHDACQTCTDELAAIVEEANWVRELIG